MLRLIGRFAIMTAVLLGSLGAVDAQQSQPVPPTDVGRQNGTLSDKLDATNGVIHPEATVDPGMEKTAPQTGRMPVIPPSGVPGKQPDAQAK